MKKLLFASFILVQSAFVYGQIGGNSTYRFLDIPASARATAMGGQVISLRDSDLNLVADNPALLDSNMHTHASMSYVNYIADVNLGYAAYARKWRNKGMAALSFQYINYGNFQEADFTGQRLGEFSAGEYALNAHYGFSLDSLFSVGATAKVIYSSLYTLNSVGLAVDLGGSYLSKNKQFSAGMVVRNAGAQIKPYTEGNREKLPLQVQAAISQRLAKAPIRLTLMVHNMQKWDLTYPENIVEEDAFGNSSTPDNNDNFFTMDKLMRHMNFGVEFLPSKSFHIRLGYNYQRRQELKISDSPGISGISMGVGMRIKKYHISYGLARYHQAGTSNHFTITTNLSDFRSKG